MARFILFAICALVGVSQAAPVLENNAIAAPMHHAVARSLLNNEIEKFVADQDEFKLIKRHWKDEEEEDEDEEDEDEDEDEEDEDEDEEDHDEDEESSEGDDESNEEGEDETGEIDGDFSNEENPNPFNLEDLFRGVFDKIVDHIIEVTPLNDIVHGNYDLLYEIFTAKVQEILSGAGDAGEQAPVDDAADAAANTSEKEGVEVAEANE